MLAPDDQLFRISLCLIGGLWVVFLARSLSIMLMLFAQLSLSGDRSSAVRNTFAQILSFGQLCTYFVFTILSSLASALLWALPFLVLVFGINLFYENYSEGLVAAIRGYNEFFVTSEVYRSFDVMAKYGRLGFEMVVPAFNFIVAALRLIPLETLRLSLQEPAQASITGMIAALGALITDGAQGIGEMLARERTLCQVGVVQDAARREAHPCLDFEYRALDLRAANGKLGEAVGHAIQLTGVLCPFASGIATVVLYPLVDVNFQAMLEHLVNAAWALLYSVWRITQLRCAMPDVASALCVPDMGPVFVFTERAVESLAKVLDRWFDVVFIQVLQVFVEREPGESCTSPPPLRGIDGNRGTHDVVAVLPLGLSRVAAVTSTAVQVHMGGAADAHTRTLNSSQAITMRYGTAAVQFGNDADEQDRRQGVLGCRCDDRAPPQRGVQLSCTIVPPDGNDEPVTVTLEATDASAAAVEQQQCADLLISVQPAHQDLQRSDCLQNDGIGGCSDIDALVYVMPECGRGGGSVACIRNSVLAFCFPFCVAVHHAGGGSRPLRLHRATQLENGGRVLLHQLFANTTTGLRELEAFAETPVRDASAPLLDVLGRSDEQPYAFAGPFALYESLQDTGSLRNITVQRLTLSAGNALRLETQLTGILLPANAVPNRDLRPSSQRNLACAMPRGVLFYAINDADDGVAAILTQSFGISGTNLGVPGSLLRLDPLNQCARTASVATPAARWCGDGLITRIDTAAAFGIVWPQSTSVAKQLLDSNSPTGLFIESVQRFDALNVLVAVRHGPLADLRYENGRQVPPAGHTTTTRSRFYFVHVDTLAVQENRVHYPAALALRTECLAQQPLPPVFRLITQLVIVQVRILRVVINDFALNGIGVIEDLLSTNDACAGRAYLHSAFDQCSAQRPQPLSFGAARAALVTLHEHWRDVITHTVEVLFLTFAQENTIVDRFFVSVGLLLFGPDAGNMAVLLQSVISNVAPAARNLALTLPKIGGRLVSIGMVNVLVLYEAYALPVLKFCLRELAQQTFAPGRLWHFATRTHYDAVRGGSLEDHILRPLDRTCFLAAELAWEPSNPIGRSILQGCRASVETLRVVLVASAEVLAVPIAHDCLCRATPTDDFCSTVIPIPWRVFYARVQAGREARSQICAEVVDRTGVQLFNAPVRLTRLLSQFGDALADAAAFLPSLTGVPGLDFTECTHPERNLDSVVMLPQPVIAFAACGLTPTCRTKCGLEIQAFEEAKLERRIQPQTYVEPGQKHALRALGPSPDLPAFDALHANLYTRSDDAWKNGDTDCLYHIVLLARERRSDWELRFFCLRTEEVGGLETERAPVSLPGTSGWRVLEVDRANDDGIGDAIEVEFLGMSPQLFNPDRTAWGVLVVQTFDTEARRSRVHRFTVAMDGTLVEDVLLDSSTVVIEQTSTVQLKQMVEQQCFFKDTFEELELVEAAATDPQHTRLTSLAILHADDSTSTSFFLVANTLIKFRDTDASTCTIPVQILAYAPYDKPTPVVDVRTGEDLLPERARGFRPHVLNEVGTQRVHIVRVETLCTYQLVHNTSMHTLSATLTEAGCRELDSDLYSFTGTARALVRAPDDPSSLRVLQVKAAANSLVARWAQELRFELDDTPVKIVRAQGITIDMTITHEQECGYMTCTSCSIGSVQKLCMAAQNCMLMECIGTRVHTGSVFCSLGLLTREFGERHFSDFIVLWQGFVEIVQVGIRTGVLGFRAAGPIRIEALSNHLTTAMCEGKDIVAVGSALLPTLTTTIVNAGRGVRLSDFSLHPSSHAFVAMSRLLSPAQRLLEIQYVSAATQVLYQLALAGVHYLYVNARILLCAMRTFNVMTGNHIEFIDHDVNVESDVCSIFLATSSYYDQNTEDRIRNLERVASSTSVGVTAVQDARGQSLVRSGDAIAVDVLRTIGTFGYADRLRRRTAARQSPKWRSRLDYRVVLFYFTAAIDWFTGLLTSFALWSKLLDPECTAAPVEMVGAMRCVCGDREAYIPRYKAEWSPQTFEPGSGDPSLWCSGILQLNDQDGVVRFIDQPYSFVELLDAWQEHGMHQLACVAFHGLDFDGCNMYCPELSNEAEREAEINRGNCQRSNVRPGSTTLDLNLGRVSPLAVLARCRENYAKKRWDPGLFAAFHEPTGAISELTTEALQRVRTLVQGLQSPLLEDCLARGPVTQNIEVCTSVYFQSPHPDAARRAASRRAYFVYGPEPSGTTTAEPDACEFLSAPFGDGFWPDETQSKIEACQSEDIPRIFARDVVNATCSVALTTRSMDRGRQDSVVDMFLDDGVVEIPDTVYAEDIEAMHNWLGDYTLPTVDDLRTHDFALESFEGDFLHRLVDCVVQGPYPEVALMPADSLGLAEALVFAKPLGNASTEPLPDVFDRHAPERTQVASQTRGSGTRIALINALLFEQRQNFAQQVHTAMDERVKHIQAQFVEGNLNAFKNADGECSANRPEDCEPAVELSTFLPLQDITGQTDTSILDKIRTQGTELLRFQTDAFNASLEAYDTHIGMLQDEQINYPVDGAIHNDRAEYQFPLQRDFSIQRQCEALLRTRVWTMRTEVRDGMLSLEALNDLFPDPDDEWAPLNRSRSDDRTRQKVAQALRDYREDDFGTSALYDYRKLALPSRFCEPTQPFEPSTPPERKEYPDIAQEWKELMGGIDLSDYDLDETLTLWKFNDNHGDADVGGMHRRCPCAEPTSALFTNTLVQQCTIAYDACEALVGKVPALDAACARATQDQPVSYPATAAAAVREALRSTRLASCPTFQPSNLWGFDITVPSLLMHGVSGVTLSNLEHVKEALPKFLGEPDRELALHGVNGTQLANALCTNQAPHDLGKVEAEALPAVHVVAASPVELACMRYVVDTVWARALHDSPEVGVAERLAANRSATLWQRRCDAKIRKLQSCQDLGTYAAGLVQTTTAADLDVCPFSVQTDTDVAFFAEACLVEVDGKLYDLWCQRPPDNAFVKSQRMSKCLVRDPRALLARNADTLAAIPGLRYDFVQELAHSPDLYDHLFPERLARSDVWFAVGSVAPPHSTTIHDTNAEEAVRVAVQDQALTDRVHAKIPGLNAIESSRYAVLDRNTGLYWKPLPVLAPTNTSSAEPVCFDSVPYWPTGWQFPLGEALAERAQDMAGFANYMAVRGNDASPRRLLRTIHASDTAARFYASTGVCREHNVGMPLQDINTHRLCTLDVASKDEACSKSAGVDTGGGLGQTLGPLFQVLRHWLNDATGGSAWNTSYQLTYAEFLRLTDATDHAEGEHDAPSGDILREQCNMFPDRLHTVLRNRRRGAPQCSRNDACNASRGEVCLPTGECREPIVEVEHRGSQTDHRVEIGFASPGCAASPATSGASPWERARHLTAQHGLCGHRHSVTYERMMLALGDRNNSRQACTLRSAGGFDYYECDRNHTEWDWVTENPAWWGRRAADLDHGKAQSVYDFAEFDLEPHPCDYDFMHAGDWGFCHTSLAGAASAEDAPSYWMRLAASHDNFTVMRDREDPGQDISTTDCGWNKLRFMGLEEAQLKPNDTESLDCKQRLGRCQDFGVCENGRFTVGGVLALRHFLGGEFGNQSEFYAMDNVEKCGPMGRVRSDAAKTCQLDEPVTVLFQTVRKHAACQEVFKAGLDREPQVLRCDDQDDRCTYARADRTQVRLQLNRLFSLHPDYLGDWQVMSKEVHENLLTCVAAVQNASVQGLGDLQRTYRLPDGRGPGIYLFMQMAAAEVPVFWWLKYALERLLLHGRARVDSAIVGYDAERLQARDVVVEVRGFAGRGTLPIEDKLGVLWTSMNTQYVFDLAAKRQVLFEAVARWLQASLNGELVFARPQALTVRSRGLLREAPEQFLRCFETLVYGVTKDSTNPPFTKVCHAASGLQQDVSMSLLEQYRFPVVQDNADMNFRTSQAMFGFSASNLVEHPGVESVLPFLQILVEKVFDTEFTAQDRNDMVDFWNPYALEDRARQSIDQAYLPVMSIRAPDGDTMGVKWENGIRAQLHASIEDFLDTLDDDGDLSFDDIYTETIPPTVTSQECIFEQTNEASMANRAKLEFGNTKAWTKAKYVLENGDVIQRNLCKISDLEDDEAPVVWTNDVQISRGSSCSFFQSPYVSRSGRTFSATSQRKTPRHTSQLPSFLTDFCDNSGEMCCPDWEAHKRWETSLETNPYYANNFKLEDDVYFGGYYETSHAEYTARREQRTNKRCVRTDTTCFLGDAKPGAKHEFAHDAWHGGRSDCDTIVSIQVPKPFHVEASYQRRNHIPLKHWLQSDKILQRQHAAYGGRLVMAVRPTPEGVQNVEHVLAAPEWSYCPDAGDVDESRLKMHTFVTENVPVGEDGTKTSAYDNLIDEEKWFGNLNYAATTKINLQRKIFANWGMFANNEIGPSAWKINDPIRDLKGPWLQSIQRPQEPERSGVNQDLKFGGYRVSQSNLRVEWEKPLGRFRSVLPREPDADNVLYRWKAQDLLCPMPTDANTGFSDPYMLGRCYEDFVYKTDTKRVETRKRVTACEMLTHIFNDDKYHRFFAENFLGLDAVSLEHTRLTELFEPLNPDISSLDLQSGESSKVWKEIGRSRFYVNKDGSYNLGEKSIETLNSPRLMSQEVLKSVCDKHFKASMYKYCRYLETTDLKVPYLFQRHLYNTYRYFSDERKDMQEDEQEFSQRTNLQLAPCMPLSKYSSLHESGRLRRVDRPLRTMHDKGSGVENAGEDCWNECGQTDGDCPEFCGQGACCRLDTQDGSTEQPLNYREADLCYYADKEFLKEKSAIAGTGYHMCVAVDADSLPRNLLQSSNLRQDTLLPAVDVAMDYFDRDGWCARGGSRQGLHLVPDVWLDLNDKLQSGGSGQKMIFPCPIADDGTRTQNCEHILQRHAQDTPTTTDSHETHIYTLNRPTCSFVLNLTQAVCADSLSMAQQQCRTLYEGLGNHEAFTRYAEPRQGVAWECRECRSYETHLPRTFAAPSKIGWGLFYNQRQIFDPARIQGNADTGFQALQGHFRRIFNPSSAKAPAKSITSYLQTTLNNQNADKKVAFRLQNETSDGADHVVYIALDEAQRQLPLPAPIVRNFREFGQRTPIEDLNSDDDDTEGRCVLVMNQDVIDEGASSCALQLFFSTRSARLASELLLASLLAGCVANADTPLIEPTVCTPHIVAPTDTRYTRLQTFTDKVLRETFGLKLPTLGHQNNNKVNVHGAHWLEGVLPFYARQKRIAQTRDDQYVQHLFNDDIRCQTMFLAEASLLDMPCFADANATVNLANPWLGGNYSFFRYLTVIQDIGNSDPRFSAGFDTCALRQTVQGLNLQPCQARTCLSDQLADEIHPDDVNRTVCKFSRELNKPYLDYEIIAKDIEMVIQAQDNLGEMYRPPLRRSLCDTGYSDAAQKQCKHYQAALGFSPLTLRGRAAAAPSLNRTSTRNRVADKISKDILRLGNTSHGASLWSGALYTENFHARTAAHTYAALAVAPEQTGFARLQLEVGTNDVYRVRGLSLLPPSDTPVPGVDWLRTAHQGVAADQARVAGNPLYSARRVLRPHWACPLLVREALTFSETLSTRHPETRMLVPDPLQARELFPDLLGVHAALRTRPVLPTELARYRMLGHHRVLPEAHLQQTMSITDARDMVRVLVQNKFEDLDVVVGGTEACLEWPRVHNQTLLRSNEEFTPGEACESAATDLGEVVANATQVRIQANADFDRTAPRGRAQAHACYRAPLLKLSDAEWDDLHDPAWQRCEDVTEGSWDKPYRQVRCIARGSEKVFNFSTTRPGSARRPYEVPQHACQASSDALATAETSLAVRQAISPLRARLRRSGLEHYEPETIWMLGWRHWNTIFMRQASESSAFFSGPWLQGPCPGAAPIPFAFDDWYDPASRESKCRAKLDDFASDAACAGRDTQVGLDLCLIAGLRELCDRLREATQHFTTLNAMRAGLVPQERAYYTPSVFVHQDGEFASTAVAATYRELGMRTCKSWTLPDNGYFDFNCGETSLRDMINFMNVMRQVILDIVQFVFKLIDFGVYFALSIGFSLLSSIGGDDFLTQIQVSVWENLLRLFIDIVEIIGLGLKDILSNMVTAIFEALLPSVVSLIEGVCDVLNQIIDIIIDTLSTFSPGIKDFLNLGRQELDVCDFLNTHINLPQKPQEFDVTSPLGDRCYVLPGTFSQLPTGLLGGVAGGLRCGPLSRCQRSAIGSGAGPCMLCEDGYDCNPLTKMCQCGVQPPPASTCTRTGFCRDRNNDAQCVLSAAGEPDTTAVQACLASTTTSLVACVFATPVDVEGTCMLVQGTARQLVSVVPGEAAPLRLRVPPGIQPGAVVDFMDTALVPTASVIINPRVTVVLQQCNLLARDVTCQVSNAVAGAAGVSGAARRLLAETTSLAGKLPSWNASGFLAALFDAPGSSIQNTTSSQDSTARKLLHETPGSFAHSTTRKSLHDPPGSSAQKTFSRQHSTARKLLQTTVADDDDVLAFDFAALGVGFDPTSLDLTNAELPACTNDKSAQVAQFMRRTAQLLAGHGWKQRELCSDEEEKRRQEILRNQPCPWVTSIASGLIDNTQELVQYYTRARQEGGCLNAVNKSCVPPPLVPASNTSSGLWPLFPQHDFAEGSVQRWEAVRLDKVQDTHTELLRVPALRAILKENCEQSEKMCVLDSPAVNFSVYRYQYVKVDAAAAIVFVPAAINATATNASTSTRVANTLLVQGSTAIVDFVLSLFDAEPDFYSTLFFNMVSLEATHHDGEFARQKRTGEYSIGRMVREGFECRFDDMIACKQQNNSLILSFCTMFFFILVITLLLPLPSVLSFFLWTLGLTLGTMYRAYGYSPWCVPLVPNCLGHGLYDIAQTFMPPRLTLPRALLNVEVCDQNGMRLSGETGPCLRRCEEAPFFIQSGIDALMHVEGVFNGGEPLGSAWQLVLGKGNDTSVPAMPEPWAGWMLAEQAELPVRIESPKWGVVTLREWTLNASARRAIDDSTRYAFAEKTWRPVHGLPVTETVVKAGRGLLYEWVGDDVWEDVQKQVGRAAQNGHRGLGDSDFAVATLLCITFFSADVVAAILAVLVGLPIVVYVVQYFVLLNLVVLQIFLDNFLSASGFDADEAD